MGLSLREHELGEVNFRGLPVLQHAVYFVEELFLQLVTLVLR